MAKTASDSTKIVQRAAEAQEKGNFDYAISLLFDVITTNPDDTKARIALRTAQKAKFEKKGHGKGTAIGAAVAGLPNLLAAAVAGAFKKHDAVILQYERYLQRNPFAKHVLWRLAKSFEASGREDQAIMTLEFLRQTSPRNVNCLRELAHIYERRNDIQRATQRYQLLLQVRPQDIEASRQIRNLAATDSIQEGWDVGETFQEKIRDKEKAVRLEAGGKIVRTADEAADAITRVKADIEAAPDRATLWGELGDLHRRREDFRAAEEAYGKALEIDPLNQLYTQKLMDVRIQVFDARIAEAKKAAAAAPADKALQQKAEALETERRVFWLSELRRRVDERPTETGLRFTLGNLYFEMGKYTEATAEFQRVVRDVKYRLPATVMLGKCFAGKGLDELAIEHLERALAEANLHDEFGKDVAYSLGGLYERAGNYLAAEDTYKKVFQLDIGYRDVAQKMETIYRMRREKNTLPKSGQGG